VNITGRDGMPVSVAKKVLDRQIFIAGYLQSVDRKHLHAALCSTGYRVSKATSKLHGRLSMSGIAAPPKHGSVKLTATVKKMAAIYDLKGEYGTLVAA
jgi:hypothetical protein